DGYARLAGYELQRDDECSLRRLRGQDRDDVGMVERGEQTRLAQQFAEVEGLFVRDLERDFLVDPGVFREVDRPKASAANRRENRVLADDLAAKEHPARRMSGRSTHGRASDLPYAARTGR